MMHVFYALVIICAVTEAIPWDIRLDHYKVGTTKDLVINTPRPRFSWKLSIPTRERHVEQIAY